MTTALSDLSAPVPRLKNKQFSHLDPAEVKKMVEEDQALDLKQFSLAFGYGYSKAKALTKQNGFPWLGGRVFPSDFRLWRRQTLGLQSAPDSAARPRPFAAGKPGELHVKHG